jgi:hypothetical protein
MLSISLLDGRRPQGSGSYLDEHWDLIVEEFRARTITSDKQANAFLDRIYLPARNRAVTASPADSENAHRRIPEGLALDVVFRLEEERPIREDWTVPYRGRLYQVRRESRYAPARARVVVYETADGRVEIFYRGRAVTSRALSGWQSARERGRPKTYGHSGRTFLSSESRDISKE